MKTIYIRTEYITLGQMLKLAGIIRNGGEAKSYLSTHQVLINNEIDNRRGRKLRDGDLVNVDNREYIIKNDVCA